MFLYLQSITIYLDSKTMSYYVAFFYCNHHTIEINFKKSMALNYSFRDS